MAATNKKNERVQRAYAFGAKLNEATWMGTAGFLLPSGSDVNRAVSLCDELAVEVREISTPEHRDELQRCLEAHREHVRWYRQSQEFFEDYQMALDCWFNRPHDVEVDEAVEDLLRPLSGLRDFAEGRGEAKYLDGVALSGMRLGVAVDELERAPETFAAAMLAKRAADPDQTLPQSYETATAPATIERNVSLVDREHVERYRRQRRPAWRSFLTQRCREVTEAVGVVLDPPSFAGDEVSAVKSELKTFFSQSDSIEGNVEKPCLTREEAERLAEGCGMSRTSFYDGLKSGAIVAKRNGSRWVSVSRQSVLDYCLAKRRRKKKQLEFEETNESVERKFAKIAGRENPAAGIPKKK